MESEGRGYHADEYWLDEVTAWQGALGSAQRRPGQSVPRGDCCAEPIELNREGHRLPVWVHVTPPADGHRVRHGGMIKDDQYQPAHQPSHKAEVERYFRAIRPPALLPEERDE